jgi:HPt (histidine-containing phosphotransfer) domain-containing protein
MKYINLNYLKSISRGDNGFVLNTINSFIEQISESLPEMDHQLITEDWEGLYTCIHRMKSGVDIMGIQSLKPTLTSIEKITSDKIDMQNLPNLVGEVKQTFKNVIQELEAEKVILAN